MTARSKHYGFGRLWPLMIAGSKPREPTPEEIAAKRDSAIRFIWKSGCRDWRALEQYLALVDDDERASACWHYLYETKGDRDRSMNLQGELIYESICEDFSKAAPTIASTLAGKHWYYSRAIVINLGDVARWSPHASDWSPMEGAFARITAIIEHFHEHITHVDRETTIFYLLRALGLSGQTVDYTIPAQWERKLLMALDLAKARETPGLTRRELRKLCAKLHKSPTHVRRVQALLS